jgi:predicted nucleotidyltransferase
MNSIRFTRSIAPDMEARILAELEAIRQREGVRILFAIESGSRAWGFPSPDSDYDVRFVYAHRADWYLTIAPGRDVIELPMDGALDVNGWDIRKTLHLLLKPNPVALEWLSSPIRYFWDDAVCRRLTDFAAKVTPGHACLHHYLHLGGRQWHVYIEDKSLVNLKKYFYVVRPAMAVRWIRMHPETAPPMNFQELLAGIDLAPALVAELEDLLKRKSLSKELGEAPRLKMIDDFITAEFAWAREAVKEPRAPRSDLEGEANALFRSIIRDQRE